MILFYGQSIKFQYIFDEIRPFRNFFPLPTGGAGSGDDKSDDGDDVDGDDDDADDDDDGGDDDDDDDDGDTGRGSVERE